MDRLLSLSFCKGPRVLKFHHTPFSQLHISSGFTTWWPPLQSADAHQLLSVWWVVICIRIRKVQKSEGKYFDTVTCVFCKVQWGVHKASVALCNFSNFYFVTACFFKGLVLTTITRSPQAKCATLNRFESTYIDIICIFFAKLCLTLEAENQVIL